MEKRSAKSITICTLVMVALIFAFAFAGSFSNATGLGSQAIFQLGCPELEGYWSDQKDMPRLSLTNWLSGDFQKSFDNWFSSHSGARNPLIRLNNQILYALFRRSQMFQGRIAISDNGSLYMTNYVDDYFHQCNAKDVEQIRHFVCDLKQLQNVLHKRGTALVFVITPSKARSYPPRIQAPWDRHPLPSRRIYDELVKQLDEQRIRYVDGRRLTNQLETNHSMQTFTPGGIHWTQVAANVTLNRVIAEINRQNGSHIPQVQITATSFGPPDAIEKDLASILNLLTPDYRYQVQHAQFQPANASWTANGKIVFEGTSFIDQFTTVASKARLFKNMRHYFYYTSALNIFPDLKKLDVDPKKIDWDREILDADAIVIEDNEGLPFDHCQHFVTDALTHVNNSALAVGRPTHYQ